MLLVHQRLPHTARTAAQIMFIVIIIIIITIFTGFSSSSSAATTSKKVHLNPPLSLILIGCRWGGAIGWTLPPFRLLLARITHRRVTRQASPATRHASHLLCNHARNSVALLLLKSSVRNLELTRQRRRIMSSFHRNIVKACMWG